MIKRYHYGLTDTLLLEKENNMSKTRAVIPVVLIQLHMVT